MVTEATVRLEVLGTSRLLVDGTERGLGGPQQRRLLAALLLRPGASVAKDDLHDWLGDGEPGAEADRALRMRVSRLRSVLAGAADGMTVRWDDGGYLLEPGPATVDVEELRTLMAAPIDDDPVQERDRMARARSLLRGEPYADLGRPVWALPAITALEALQRDAADRWAAALIGAGDAALAAAELRLLVEEDPFRERRWELLMRALYRAGRQRDALLAYGEMVERFDRDLGLRPGPNLRALEAAILAHDPALHGDPAGARPTVTAGGLPAFAAPLVGRDREVAAVVDALAVGRLVTVTGPGGVGKTRLAVAVAVAQAHRFWDGMWFVDLSVARPGDDVAALVQQQVAGHRREGEHEPGDALEGVLTALDGKAACLVLDNAEQVASEVGAFVAALLDAQGSVRVLVTSRTVLGVLGERVVPVGPLDDDAGAELLRTQAAARGAPVSSLEQRALVAVCRRLDGLPLALELAAGWLRVLPPASLVERLAADAGLLEERTGDRAERHRTLDACMAWSHALLAEGDRAVFEAASLFAGPWTTADAAAVAGTSERSALDAVARLVDASLVRPRPDGSFELLPIVAAFGRAEVDRAPDGAARRLRLADRLVARTAELELALRGPGFDAALAALDAYEPTVQLVLDQLLADGENERFTAIVAYEGDFWYATGRRRRAIERCEQALALPPVPSLVRARVLTHAAGVRSTGDLVANRPMLDEAIAILEQLGETEAQTWAALFLVVAHDADGDTAAGTRWLEHARRCAGDVTWNHAVVDVFEATHRAWSGDAPSAPPVMERAYRTFLALGDRPWQARAQWILATYLRGLGDTVRARDALLLAVAHAEAAGDRVTAEHARFGLVRLDPDSAVAVSALRRCVARFAELGDTACEAAARRELARRSLRVG